MARKRKLNSSFVQQPVEEPKQVIEEDPDELEFEEFEEEEIEVEEEEEEVEEEKEEVEVEEEELEEDEEEVEAEEEEDELGDEEPIQSIVSSFSKEALIDLLTDAVRRHDDVAKRVREAGDTDPSRRKIFVHGLSWSTTSEMLLEEFLKYGEIEGCDHVTDKKTGNSRGYAFILFKSGRAAREALKEPQKMIDNRMTACQLASLGPNAGQLQTELNSLTQRKIYVSNVGPELDPVKLKAFFSQFGEIEEGPLGLDKATGRPKGFCLFVYKTAESAKSALAVTNRQFEGVTLRCCKAIDGPKHHKEQNFNPQKYKKKAKTNPNQRPFHSPVAPSPVAYSSAFPLVQQQQQGLNVNPAALGQALTTLLTAQGGGGLNLLAALGAVGAGLVNNPAVVPGSGSQHHMQGGYGNQSAGTSTGGVNGMGVYGNQGGNLNQFQVQGGGGSSQQ